MTRKIGILFDLDGVLVDSEGEYSLFWGSIGDRYDKGADFKDRIKGSILPRILESFPEGDRAGIKAELYDFEGRMQYAVYPGVKEFLQVLKEKNIPAAIVTSSDNAKMEKLFARHPDMRECITHIVTADMVSKGKPDPECFLLGAGLIEVPIEDCFVFEDSINGLKAARASGGKVVGLATTCRRSEVERYADLTADCFGEITLERLAAL